jgi:Tol biopolymer transport system component
MSPDGKQIAFNSHRSGAYEVWVMPAAGSQAQVNSDGSNQHVLVPASALGGTGIRYSDVDERVISWR